MQGITDQTPKKRRYTKKKYPRYTKVRYKIGDIIGNKEIIRQLPSRGNNHYYLIRCQKCNKLSPMHQESLTKDNKGVSIGCRHCTRSPFRGRLQKTFWSKRDDSNS